MKGFSLIEALCLVIVLGILSAVFVAKVKEPYKQIPCAHYADSNIAYVPARCITYFNNK